MKVPTALLPHKIVVEPYLGSTGLGEIYGPAQPIKARVEAKRRAVRRPDGTDIVGTAVAIVRPEASVAEQSKVRVPNGDELLVLEVRPGEGLARPAFLELILGTQG